MTNAKVKVMQIRELKLDDLPIRVEWMSDPKVYSSMHFEVPILLDNTIKWFEKNKKNENRRDVVFLDDNKIVAFGGLTSIIRDTQMAELYIFVDPNSQHRGIGTDATTLLCQWGFSTLGLRKIYLYTNEDNHAAIKAYEKCGFVLEGRHRLEYKNNSGDYKDRLYFGLLKTDLERCDFGNRIQ